MSGIYHSLDRECARSFWVLGDSFSRGCMLLVLVRQYIIMIMYNYFVQCTTVAYDVCLV